jgi:hypothetical protein
MDQIENSYQEQLFKERQQLNKKSQKQNISAIIEVSDLTREIEANKVTLLLRFILVLSVLADVLGIIPVIGNIFGIFFAIIFFILYFLNGLGRGSIKGTTRRVLRKRVSRWAIRVFFLSAEGVPILGILPLFTIMALIEIALSQRITKKLVNKMEEATNKIK